MRLLCAFLLAACSWSSTDTLESRLDRQVKSWQKRLGLDEWNVSLRIARQAQIGPDSWGTSEWDPSAKTALISVLDPRDYNLKGSELRLDMECTIVHELVHIQVSPLAAHSDNAREAVVVRLTSALLNRACPN